MARIFLPVAARTQDRYTSPMGIWDRLGSVIKSYLNDDAHTSFGGSAAKGYAGRADPDLDAAYEELDDFLNEGKNASGAADRGEPARPRRPVPQELKADFAELGLSPDASAAECKAAYKKLLKIHHPDRHAGNPENMKKATEKAARVNAAYRRLENWFKIRP